MDCNLLQFPHTKIKSSFLSAGVSVVVCAAGLLLGMGGTAGATNSPCTTTGSYTACQTFLEIGSDQSFTVPAGVTSVHAELWGAGGGGPNPNGYWASQAGAGGGGYTTADISVTPGEVLNIVVGQGGQMNSDSSTYGGGGAGGFSGYAPAVGGSGGGMSAIFHATTPLLIAGGGGGASPGAEGANLTVAGGGGGTQGGNGTYTDVSGQGGTQSTGGARGNSLALNRGGHFATRPFLGKWAHKAAGANSLTHVGPQGTLS